MLCPAPHSSPEGSGAFSWAWTHASSLIVIRLARRSASLPRAVLTSLPWNAFCGAPHDCAVQRLAVKSLQTHDAHGQAHAEVHFAYLHASHPPSSMAWRASCQSSRSQSPPCRQPILPLPAARASRSAGSIGAAWAYRFLTAIYILAIHPAAPLDFSQKAYGRQVFQVFSVFGLPVVA